MTAFRIFSLPAHGAIELVVGLATMAAPFALGFGPAGTVAAVAIGALIAGLALSTGSSDRGGLSVGGHFAADRGIAFGLLLSAAVLGAAADDRPAALFLAAMAVTQTGLNITTRYSQRP
jgi:hypothetical protein